MQRMLLTLLDGTTVFIRPIEPEDKPCWPPGCANSARRRPTAASSVPRSASAKPSSKYLTEVDGHDHIAYVAVTGDQLVAVGRVVRTDRGHRGHGDRRRRSVAGPRARTAPGEAARRAGGRGGRDPDRGHDARRQPARVPADEAASGPASSTTSSPTACAKSSLVWPPERFYAQAAPGGRRCLVGEPPSRSVSALLVDVPAGHARAGSACARRCRLARPQRAGAGRRGAPRRRCSGGAGTRSSTAATDQLAVPSRKALEMVRLADPHLPFWRSRRGCEPGEAGGDPARAAGTACRPCPTWRQLPAVLTRELEQARMRRRVGGAHSCWARSRRSRTISRRGWSPCCRIGCSTTLGARSGGRLRRRLAAGRLDAACIVVWLRAGRARRSRCRRRPTSRSTPPARAPRAVWAFRRPVWVGDLPPRRCAPARHRRRVPDRHGEECVGVIELYAPDAREPNAEVSALFATVGGQLAAFRPPPRPRPRPPQLRRRRGTGRRPRRRRPREIANGTASAAFGFERGRPGRPRLVRRGPGARTRRRPRRLHPPCSKATTPRSRTPRASPGAGRAPATPTARPGALGWGEPEGPKACRLPWLHASLRLAAGRRLSARAEGAGPTRPRRQRAAQGLGPSWW